MSLIPRPRQHTAALLRRMTDARVVESVPEGRLVELPGRGTTYVVDVPGPEGAPTIVLLHALGCTGYLSWHQVIEPLSREYRVVIMDQRWHGRGILSPRFELHECADDAVALLDVLGIDQAIPVGYSMGGLVAQLVWRRHPERVQGLVLCATARNFRGAAWEKLAFPLVSSALLPLRGVVRAAAGRARRNLPELPSFASAEHTWGLDEFLSTSAWTSVAVLDALGRFSSHDWIGGVDVPTSVVVPNRDRAIPSARQRRLAAAIPGAEVFELDGGHMSLVLQAEQFEATLLAALTSVTARSRDVRTRVSSLHPLPVF